MSVSDPNSQTEQSSAADRLEIKHDSDSRRWRVLVLLCVLQAMILLDMTMVNIALPQIQDGLGFSRAGLVWVVDGYALMAGGFLVLGGRLADVLGRRRLLISGIVVFGISSMMSGLAPNPGVMVAGRFGQGLAEALAAPASLGLLALLFTDPKERTKAFGAWAGISGMSATLGYILSGVITEFLDWRWLFFINVPVAVVALVLIPRMVGESRMRSQGRVDYAGALGLTVGMVALVFGLVRASSHAWTSTQVLVPVLIGVAVLAVTVVIEAQVSNPLVPLSFFANRTRSVMNFASVFFMAAFLSYTFMLTLFNQQILGYSPLITGLAWLPLSVGIGVGIGIGTALVPRLGVKAVCAVSFFVAGVGLLISSLLQPDNPYWTTLLPGMVVFGLGAGLGMPSGTNAALHKVTADNSSLASGVQSTAQQIGGALGVAVLVTLAIRYAEDHMATGASPAQATTDGYALALRIGAGLAIFCAVLVAALLERVDTEMRDPIAEQATNIH